MKQYVFKWAQILREEHEYQPNDDLRTETCLSVTTVGY